MQEVKLVQNVLVQKNFQFYCAVVRFDELIINSAGDVSISLESVEMSNNNFVPLDGHIIIGISALSVVNTEVHCKGTGFFNNNMSAVSIHNSDLHFHGVNVFKNNTGRQCGGALVLTVDSHIYLHEGTQVYILENTALKYGGGICVDGGSISEVLDTCFYQIADLDILNNNDTFVYMEGNIAPITGYDIYAGHTRKCITTVNYRGRSTSINSYVIFLHVFHFGSLNSSLSTLYQVSSNALYICFCNQRSELVCDATVVPHISVYPGQVFGIIAAGMGVGISPAVVRSKIYDKYDIFPKLQSLGNACEPLNYTILAPENISGILVQLSVEGAYLNMKYLNLTTLKCPQGFVLRQSQCKCHPMLQRASVHCDINTQRFTRSGSVWIGMGSDEEGLLTHMYCPNAYCKLQETKINLTSPDVYSVPLVTLEFFVEVVSLV